MRLLKRLPNGDFKLVTFSDNNVPPYAILSHTWSENEEVSYQELVEHKGKAKAGYEKIRLCLEQAAKDGLRYAWVDTCAIDKSSSAELQEAINSMFKWYEQAAICYVYLGDVTDATSITSEESEFHRARWHTRGWTLQELLAPRKINFYTRHWTFIGTKYTLCQELSAITRISVDILTGDAPITYASVAQRMSWASRRETSRLEDIAYCLMGIFGVNMTMLYGEGSKAFMRLQEEISKECNDNSIFAWQNIDGAEAGKGPCGLLADHPRHFRDSWAVSSEDGGIDYPNAVFIAQTPFAMVNQGIQMESYLLTLRSGQPEVRILVLRCRTNACSYAGRGHLGILIQRKRLPGRGMMYVRIRSDALTLSQHRPHLTQTIMLAKAGLFPDDDEDEELEELDTSRYELGALNSNKLGELYLNIAPVYISQGSFTSWKVVAWTAFHRFYERMNLERKHLGQATFHRDDGEEFTIQLAIRKRVKEKTFFSSETTTYSGEASWVKDPGTGMWGWENRYVKCGDEHRLYMYVDEFSDLTAQHLVTSYMDFTFLIRIRPAEGLANSIIKLPKSFSI